MADNYKEIVNHLSLFCGNKYAICKQSLRQENGLEFFIAKDGEFPNEYKVA